MTLENVVIGSIRCLAAIIALVAPEAVAGVRLDLRDARLLVEDTPVFLQAIKNGDCPQTSDANAKGDTATVVVRGGCNGFGWIGDFYVDLTDGTITTDGGVSGPAKIETQSIADLRSALFAKRANERLSPAEALCLLHKLLEQATAEPCRRYSIDQVQDSAFIGVVRNICENANQPVPFVVDRYNGKVTSMANGEVYNSSVLDNFRSTVLTAKAPARLSVDDAETLVQAPPVVASLAAIGLLTDKGCLKVTPDPFNNAEEIWLQLTSGCHSGESVLRLSINDLTGEIRIIGSNMSLASPAVLHLCEEAVGKAKSRKAEATEQVKKECR